VPVENASGIPEIIVYGTVCLDRFLLAGMDEVVEFPGGEAFNTATALVGWGVRVALTGTALGSDPEADRLRHLLDTHPLGVPREYVPNLPEAVTPVCTVRVDVHGERHMSGRGFREAVAPTWESIEPLFVSRPILTIDPNLGDAATETACRAASQGCPVVAMDFVHVPEVVRTCRILVTSQEWIARAGTGETPEQAVHRLAATGARTAIVTLGAAGGIVYDREAGLFTFPAVVPPRAIVDTTGAGDTFRAGLCYGLLHDLTLQETLSFAAQVAARHCTVLGGGSRLPLP